MNSDQGYNLIPSTTFVRSGRSSKHSACAARLLMLFQKRLAMLVAYFFLGLTTYSVSQTVDERPSSFQNDSIFSQPRIQRQVLSLHQQATVAFANKDYALAESLTQQCLQYQPGNAASHYNLACAQARLKKHETAIKSLRRSISNGFRNVTHMASDDDLVSLHSTETWPELLKFAAMPYEPSTPEPITATVITDGVAMVDSKNTFWNPAANRFEVTIKRSAAVPGPLPLAVGNDAVALQLNKWQKEGTAVGLSDILYDNHDRDHSNMNWKRFPQLTRIEYSEAAKQENLDNGLQHQFQFSKTTFGNSSTAMVGNPYWRSQPRLAYADGPATAQLAAQYFRNHLYVYPEHKDYDPGRNGNGGFGDVYPVNTPFLVVSQGSSYSDKPFLNAIAATLAAFQPDVMSKLEASGMVSPCMQMILRRCMNNVKTDADYLSGGAHPVVFDGQQLNVKRMIEMAHNISRSNIPPLAIMQVNNESESTVGKDYFEVSPREILFTSAVAIARVFRSTAMTKTITVDAGKSIDINNHKLTWHWAVLQGDPQKIQIQNLNKRRSKATITIEHHQRRPVQPGSKTESGRVDIAVFVNNGTYFSPPSIISFYCPENEQRVYDTNGKIKSVQYTDFYRGGDYADPMIVTAKDWRDEYLYSESGIPNGWIRYRGNQTQTFTTEGTMVTASDDLGRPVVSQTVRYVAVPRPGKTPLLQQIPAGETILHSYDSPTDVVGSMRKSLDIQAIE